MRSRVAELSPRAQAALAAAAVLLYAAAVWFLLVAPKRSEAASLAADVEAAELQLVEARTAATRPRTESAPVSDVVLLARAMPPTAEQPSLVLELTQLARRAGVTLASIAPKESEVDVAGATRVPVAVSVSGSYSAITRFLQLTRRLVRVSGGELRAAGRLFNVQGVELSESSTGVFPKLDAVITLNAYAYDGPIAPPTPPTPTPAPSDDGTTGTAAAGGAP